MYIYAKLIKNLKIHQFWYYLQYLIINNQYSFALSILYYLFHHITIIIVIIQIIDNRRLMLLDRGFINTNAIPILEFGKREDLQTQRGKRKPRKLPIH